MAAAQQEENARLRQEVADLTRALQAFESRSSSSPLQERAEARRLFDLFDTNRDGLLGDDELRQLASRLGEDPDTFVEWSKQDGGRRRGEEEGAAGGDCWTFDRFYAWWSANDDIDGGGGDDGNGEGTPPPVSAAVRAKLRSQPLMRAMLRLIEYSNQGLASPADKGKAKDTCSEGLNDPVDELCKAQIDIRMGSFETAACDATLTWRASPEEAREHRKQYAAKEDDIIISIHFGVVEGVDDFQLGELAGNLRNIFSTAHIRSDYKLQQNHETGRRTFKVTLLIEHSSLTEHITVLFSGFQIRDLEAHVQLSEEPLEESQQFIRAHASLSALYHRSAIDFIQSGLSVPEDRNNGLHPSDILSLFSSLKELNLNLRFDNLVDLLRQSFPETPLAQVCGWQSGAAAVTQMVRSKISRSRENRDAMVAAGPAYTGVKRLLSSLDSIRLQVDEANIIELKGRNLNIIGLLPSLDELIERHPRPGQSSKLRFVQ